MGDMGPAKETQRLCDMANGGDQGASRQVSGGNSPW